MSIQADHLIHWANHFYGYGAWEADIWFVALEEGGGEVPEEVDDKFRYFSTQHAAASGPTLCDIRSLYTNVAARLEGKKAGLYKNLHEYRFGKEAQLQSMWKNLIGFEFAYRNDQVPDFLDYQRHRFLSTEENREALLKLYPLPSPHSHSWYYNWLGMREIPYLASRSAYEQFFFNSRIQTIIEKIKAHEPTIVLMYGMSNINQLKDAFTKSFEGALFKSVKGSKNRIPQHHQTLIGSTIVIITTQIPTLRHNRIESGFDWEAFGRLVRD